MKHRTIHYQAKHLRRGRSKATAGRRAAPVGKKNRTVVRFALCGGIFVLLVAVKLLFPQTMGQLQRSVGELLGRDADFKEAFAAVGRAVSGEEAVSDSLQDAYMAVFNPMEIPAEETAEPATVSSEPVAYPQLGESYRHLMTPVVPVPNTLIGDETAATGEETEDREASLSDVTTDCNTSDITEIALTASASYIYTMPALPENASLEQRCLGFPYESPLCGTLTSPFGWRDHPVSGGDKFHYGVDLAGNVGDAICAFADGEVYATGESSTLGKYIMLRHQGGYVTLYAHCNKVIKTGGSVKMGEKIAEVGQTGTATGPHLHFELHDGALYLNPIYYVEIL